MPIVIRATIPPDSAAAASAVVNGNTDFAAHEEAQAEHFTELFSLAVKQVWEEAHHAHQELLAQVEHWVNGQLL